MKRHANKIYPQIGWENNPRSGIVHNSFLKIDYWHSFRPQGFGISDSRTNKQRERAGQIKRKTELRNSSNLNRKIPVQLECGSVFVRPSVCVRVGWLSASTLCRSDNDDGAVFRNVSRCGATYTSTQYPCIFDLDYEVSSIAVLVGLVLVSPVTYTIKVHTRHPTHSQKSPHPIGLNTYTENPRFDGMRLEYGIGFCECILNHIPTNGMDGERGRGRGGRWKGWHTERMNRSCCGWWNGLWWFASLFISVETRGQPPTIWMVIMSGSECSTNTHAKRANFNTDALSPMCGGVRACSITSHTTAQFSPFSLCCSSTLCMRIQC